MRRVWIVLALSVATLSASTLSNQGLDRGYRQLYNLQFDAAHHTFEQWTAQHPTDPLGPASDAVAYLFAEMDRLQILQAQFFTSDHDFLAGPKGPPDPAFERQLVQAEALAANAPPNDVTALYAQALCHGLRADYLGIIQKRYLASLGEMKQGRVIALRLLALDPNYADAYLAVGIENYILGLKPAPVRWLLRLDGASTNKEEGLRELGLTAEQGHYLRPYAQILLALAALRDHHPDAASRLLFGLGQQFPLNPLYARELQRLSATVRFDPAQTQVHFTLGAFLHTVHGEFKLTKGAMQFDPSTGAASGEIEIDASTGESGNAGRDRDMQAKVLESARYPAITFTPDHVEGQVARQGDSTVEVHGVLNLHGADHEVTLPMKVHIDSGRFAATTRLEIPYVKWGLKNPSNLVLHVSDTVALAIEAKGEVAWPTAAISN